MAQSALTVTPPSPTPPTNMSFTGATSPNPPNFSITQIADPFGARDANGNLVVTTPPGVGVDPTPPPYFDDGTAGSLVAFAANTAALASGSAGTAGGTPGSYPGAANGVVPASTSVPHEGAGTEVVATTTYTTGTSGNGGGSVGISSAPPLQTVSVLGSYTINPNAQHASSLSPVTNPAFASLTVGSAVSGTGTTLLTCTGTNFTPGCRIWVDGIEKPTTFVSATSLTSTIAKKPTAGTWPVDVKLGGVAVPSTRTITWT